MIQEYTYEELVSSFLHFREVGESCCWGMVAVVRVLLEKLPKKEKVKMAKTFASDVGLSAKRILDMYRVAVMFGIDVQKILSQSIEYLTPPPLSFEHYRLASYTDRPQEWIKESIDGGWTVADLRHYLYKRTKKNKIKSWKGEWHTFTGTIEEIIKKINETFAPSALAICSIREVDVL